MTVGNWKIYKDLYVCVYGLNCFGLLIWQQCRILWTNVNLRTIIMLFICKAAFHGIHLYSLFLLAQ